MLRYRIAILMCIFLGIYLFLVGKLAYHQLINGSVLAQEAAAMRNRTIELKEYSRGVIYDRNHVPITDTYTSMALYCLPTEMGENKDGDFDQQLGRAARILGDSLDKKDRMEILLTLQQAAARGEVIVRIASDLTVSEIDAVKSSGLSGVIVAPVIKRYRQDGFCVHLLGYLGKGEECSGMAGLEKKYDQILAGSQPSNEIVSVLDARGMAIHGLMFRIKQSQNTNKGSVVLTIDSRIQEIVEKTMDNHIDKGAVIVMDVDTKEVLAMASKPDYNPYQDIEKIISNDSNSTLCNRAIDLLYHPGSLFKILVTAAVLEEGLVSPENRFYCQGEYTFGNGSTMSCWNHSGHGHIEFSDAFALSCNPAFVGVTLKLGRERLVNYAERFHITDETLLGFCGDRDAAYVNIDYGERALAHACIGQEGVMLTPLQLGSLIATIADDGQWQQPALVKYSINGDGVKTSIEREDKEQVISPATARLVQDFMIKTVLEGTGKTAALEQVQVAGKTATSQVIIDDKETFNAWFGGFFPADKPRWAIVVLVEDAVSGAENAAPVFKEIVQGMMGCYQFCSGE